MQPVNGLTDVMQQQLLGNNSDEHRAIHMNSSLHNEIAMNDAQI